MDDMGASEDSFGNSNVALSTESAVSESIFESPEVAQQPAATCEAPTTLEAAPAIAGSGHHEGITGTSNRKNRWPAYFFPSLSVQRMAFCMDILKKEDIRSVSGARTICRAPRTYPAYRRASRHKHIKLHPHETVHCLFRTLIIVHPGWT